MGVLPKMATRPDPNAIIGVRRISGMMFKVIFTDHREWVVEASSVERAVEAAAELPGGVAEIESVCDLNEPDSPPQRAMQPLPTG